MHKTQRKGLECTVAEEGPQGSVAMTGMTTPASQDNTTSWKKLTLLQWFNSNSATIVDNVSNTYYENITHFLTVNWPKALQQ